ncbi:MAG TPA: PAS domain-containing sensor histidine kinase [Azospirillum sp.]|nr:PAS domain-containing sensor histidine kinase [Azospirillum sp.]
MSSPLLQQEVRNHFDPAIFESTAEGCIVVDNNYFVVYANAALCALLDRPLHDIVGRHALELTAPESHSVMERQRTLCDIVPHRVYEVCLLRRGGGRVFAIVCASRLYDSGGAAIGSFAFVTDITQHRRNELQLQQQREQLHTTIRLLNRLFEGVSRDMRDPLNAILGVPQMLLAAAPLAPREVDGYLGLCRVAGEQMLRMVENLSTWTRLQLDQIALEPAEYELNDIVREALEPFGRLADRNSQRIVNRIGRVRVRTDLNATNSVLQHLIDNALRFSPKGSAVELLAAPDGGWVAVSVRDEGPGIPPDVQPYLFRLDHPHPLPDAEGQLGGGFGLLICRSLVERLGGTIGVDSRPGAGTRVTFTLPSAMVQ